MVKKIFSFIISLLLMFSILVSIFLGFFKVNVTNIGLYSEALSKSMAAKSIYDDIYSEISYLLGTYNIPRDTLNDIITVDEIKKEINDKLIYISEFIDGKKIIEEKAQDNSIYLKRLDDKLDAFIKENSIPMTEELSFDLSEIRKSIDKFLTSELNPMNINKFLSSNLAGKVQKVISLINSDKLKYLFLGLDLLFIIIIAFIWHKHIIRGITWIGYSFSASGLIVFLLSFSGYISKFYNNLILGVPYLKNTIIYLIKVWLKNLSLIGLLFIGIGIIIMILNISHYKNKRKKVN
ncbi:MAG: hypothetical protein SOY42_02330 [Clostridium sp.]|nr:hypothetical protein [Clostridium sp.]